MRERIYNAMVAILAAEQHMRKIDVGDCDPLTELELNDNIDALARTMESILMFQEEAI